jgi:exoribonuclease R
MHIVLNVDNRYKEWNWVGNNKKVYCDIDPVVEKYFNKDVVFIEDLDGKPYLVSSPTKDITNIPGVLLITGNTYGRFSKNKLLYKCLPNDTALPAFLIPYQLKKTQFCKNITNLYVTFSFHSWDDKHPIGSLQQNLGEVSELVNFCEYKLYCKNIHHSITQFTKQTCAIIKTKSESLWVADILEKHPHIEDRRESDVMTIDPVGSRDLDDGIGMKTISTREIMISVYIANVSLWLDILQLWGNFSERVSTIYLPEFKRTMLPSILSENMCSLLKNQERFAFTMDVLVDTQSGEILSVNFVNSLISVKENYAYEHKSLLWNPVYKQLLCVCKNINNKYAYLDAVSDSHDVVALLMIMMNHQSALSLKQKNNGIFRTQTFTSGPEIEAPQEISGFIKMWKYSESKYSINNENTGHQMIGQGLNAYTHITSPIRRLVDLLNMIQLQHNLGLVKSESAMTFLFNWTCQLEKINKSMKDIRRVQTDCQLLQMVETVPEHITKTHVGYLFDKASYKRDVYQYSVYLPQLKLISSVKSRGDYDQYHKTKISLYLFTGEESIKKKVKIELIP